MKIKILATIALLMASITLQANEEMASITLQEANEEEVKEQKWYNGIYVGLGTSFTEGMEITLPYELGKLDLFPNNILVDVYAGYELHKYLDIELNLSNVLGYTFEETYSSFGYSSIFTTKYTYYTVGFTVKPKYYFNENHVVFGVLGANLINGKVQESYQNSDREYFDYKTRVSTLSYRMGLGYEYKLNNESSLLVEYSYNILDDVELSTGEHTAIYNDGKAGSPTVNNYNLFGISYKITLR